MISSIGSCGGASQMMLSGMRGGGGFPSAEKMQEQLAKADTNGDGSVDKAELGAMQQNRPGMQKAGQSPDSNSLFDWLDTDGDDAVSQAEAGDGATRLLQELEAQLMSAQTGRMSGGQFSHLDANGDGGIDKTELAAAQEDRAARGLSGTTPDMDELFSQADTDGNGQLNQDEFSQSRNQHRNRMAETNGDSLTSMAWLQNYQASSQSMLSQMFGSLLDTTA